MFSTLESSWDRSARRGWSAIASFTFQALALSLLLAIPMFWVQGPPSLHWFQPITAPITQASPAEMPIAHERNSANPVSNPINSVSIAPRYFQPTTPFNDDHAVEPPPDLATLGVEPGDRNGVLHGLGKAIPTVVPKPPAPIH